MSAWTSRASGAALSAHVEHRPCGVEPYARPAQQSRIAACSASDVDTGIARRDLVCRRIVRLGCAPARHPRPISRRGPRIPRPSPAPRLLRALGRSIVPASSRRNTGCFVRDRDTICSSVESGPTPSKNWPTSNFHRFRYAREYRHLVGVGELRRMARLAPTAEEQVELSSAGADVLHPLALAAWGHQVLAPVECEQVHRVHGAVGRSLRPFTSRTRLPRTLTPALVRPADRPVEDVPGEPPGSLVVGLLRHEPAVPSFRSPRREVAVPGSRIPSEHRRAALEHRAYALTCVGGTCEGDLLVKLVCHRLACSLTEPGAESRLAWPRQPGSARSDLGRERDAHRR